MQTWARVVERKIYWTMKPLHPAIAIPTGGLAGMLGGLCGVGGGIVITPLLRHFTSASTQTITGTAMLSVTASAIGGGGAYASQGIADLPAAATMASTAMCTTGLGVAVSRRISSGSLSRVFGLFLLGVAPLIAMRSSSTRQQSSAEVDRSGEEMGTRWERKRQSVELLANPSLEEALRFARLNAHFAAAGVVTGFSAGLLGVGGGIVMTTFMAMATDMTQHEAVATSVLAMIPTGLSSSFFHWRAGNIQLRAAALLAASSTVAMTMSATYVAPNVSEEKMRYLFSALLLASGLRMLL